MKHCEADPHASLGVCPRDLSDAESPRVGTIVSFRRVFDDRVEPGFVTRENVKMSMYTYPVVKRSNVSPLTAVLFDGI